MTDQSYPALMLVVSGNLDVAAELKAAGLQTRFGSTWAGPWSKVVDGKVPSLASHIRICVAEGLLPIIQFFGAGDQLTPAFFRDGTTTSRGMNRGSWWALVKATAATIAASGVKGAVVNLELEWFKKAMQQGAPEFDTAWADAASTIRRVAPGTLIASCPGGWAASHTFTGLYPKVVAAADVWAVQNLRSQPRHGPDYADGPDYLLGRLKDYRAAFPDKALIVSDLGYSSYGGSYSPTHPFQGGDGSAADQAQRAAFERLIILRPDLEALGVTDLVLRSLRDVDMEDTTNHHGAAEDHWGLVRRDGGRKPAYQAFIQLAAGQPAEPPKLYTQAEVDGFKELVREAEHRHAESEARNAVLEAKIMRARAELA